MNEFNSKIDSVLIFSLGQDNYSVLYLNLIVIIVRLGQKTKHAK